MGIDEKLDPANSIVTQKGMVQFESAAISFLYNSGSIDIYGYLGLLRVSLGFLRDL